MVGQGGRVWVAWSGRDGGQGGRVWFGWSGREGQGERVREEGFGLVGQGGMVVREGWWSERVRGLLRESWPVLVGQGELLSAGWSGRTGQGVSQGGGGSDMKPH
ncbi:hypothetical protein Pmani_037429 [Petrolisthes manimaculis]|uniref:Uncharacterized protein n=1 Tax=Petrolisthes manimaculis TaxID=1843537 RepID=A0AAE1NIA1_9EUCA|nr:hypothetical protein Pmani_037429 [Petrolisthes manimaculis]